MTTAAGGTFGPNKVHVLAAAFAALGCAAFALPYFLWEDASSDFFLFGGLGFLGCCAYLAWVLSVRASLDERGIYYRSLFGAAEMKWDEVEQLWFIGERGRIAPYAPASKSYHLRITDRQGKTLTTGGRFERTGELADRIFTYTTDRLFEKCWQRFQRGEEVDFGRIRLHRDRGMGIRKGGSNIDYVPWTEVNQYGVKEGKLYVWRVGQKRAHGHKVQDIANPFALVRMLETLTEGRGPSLEELW